MAELQNGLPPGWDCKLDKNSGKYYYVNHYTRTTTWEDPRNRHMGLNGTPMHLAKVPVEHIPLQEMRSMTRSPLTLRSARIQDSSLTSSSHSSTDTDDSVAKLSAMFPTVSETHIKLLLKNCRYMKSLFSNADETIILECLQNCDNNIQKTSELLREMGYSKKETIDVASPKVEPKVTDNDRVHVERPQEPSPIHRMRTSEEKRQMKAILQEQYNDVPEHLISIALESVNFDETRANQILKIMKQEDSETENSNRNKKIEEPAPEAVPSTSQSTSQLPISQSRQSIKSLLKSEKKDEINGFSRIVDQNDDNYKSPNLSNTMGHNPQLSKGPNDKLLLANYIQWQGSSKTLLKGSQGLAKGPNKNLLSNKVYTPCGPNSEMRKGAKFGLAKGSIFTQLKSVVVGESRVK